MTERCAAELLQAMAQSLNDHDLPRLVSLFHPDYQSIQPVHPERSFTGRDKVAENWAWVFDHFEGFAAEVLDVAVQDSAIWAEWSWEGTNPNGEITFVRGVMILTVESGYFTSGRLYMEPLR